MSLVFAKIVVDKNMIFERVDFAIVKVENQVQFVNSLTLFNRKNTQSRKKE